ncbi:hypothetical protein ACFB49_32680 [Sphingomonas sp. DBB INV C78]|uniref:DUF1214 domain-containing protein n=1 Tax=Sphingomonas sp. DBB INV C78 TaxID=3349434 RepID=UPI0036D3DC25
MGDDIAALRSGWNAFCEELKRAGENAFLPSAPNGGVDRAAGLRQVARNIALALQFELENADPLHPELAHYFDPVRKQGGDNPDALYLGAPINGLDHYRIQGHRGTADYVAITAVEKGETPFGGRAAAILLGDELEVAADGRFELNIGPDPCGPNWLRSSPDTYRVTIRQFFSDWENEQPMRAMIERIGCDAPRPVLASQELLQGLKRSATWLGPSVRYWTEMLSRWKARPHTFLAYSELETNEVDATPGGEPVIAYWQLQPDEILVIRVKPPAARYWSVELGNAWWESMDYRDRFSSTNRHYAELDPDGMMTILISHDDPGVPNWLDASGHSEGYITFRWIGVDRPPRPMMTRLTKDQLGDSMKSCRRVGRQERMEQLDRRRWGLLNRGML